MITAIAETFRRQLSPRNRRLARSLVDPMLGFVGTAHGARKVSSSVALTFDDGPDPLVTPRMLDLLRERNAKSTFFMLSDHASRYPALVRRVVDDGHEVGLHCDRHDRLTTMSFSEIKQRLGKARLVLEQLCETPIRLFRPPYGAQSLVSFVAARSLGFEIVAWGPYAEDWIDQTAEASAAKVLGGIKGGDIALFHDGLELADGTPAPKLDRVRVVELVLDGLAERSLGATTVGRLLAEHGTRRTAWFRQ